MIHMPRTSALLTGMALTLGLAGCTYYQAAPGVYATAPSAFERSFSAAVGAMEDEGVRLVTLDRNAGKASGIHGGINVTATVQSRADSGVQVEFGTSGDTAADPTLIDRITRRYNARMGR
jgi:hypothetical protein